MRLWSLTLLSGLVLVTAGQAQLSAPTVNNRQYFTYNGVPIALVGISGEYLPHVTRPTKQNAHATLESYPAYLTDLNLKKINKIRIWLAVNHSIGLLESDPATKPDGKPYPSEQPYFFNGNRWRLDRWDEPAAPGDPTFFDNVRAVLAFAAQKNIMVEVTLFDPFQGTYSSSPWYPGVLDANGNVITSGNRNLWYNSQGQQQLDAGFMTRELMIAFDNDTSTTTDNHQRNKNARALQVKFVEEAVRQLNGYTNFYWEIANEPDFNPIPSAPAMIHWHNFIAQKIVAAEAPLPNKHAIAANFNSQAAQAEVHAGNLDPNIKVVSSHYVDLPTGAPRRGAIELNRLRNTGTGSWANIIFGFNESMISPSPNDRRGSRAEAWEFMLSEGGLYDNLGYSWTSSAANDVRTDLGKLAEFMSGVQIVATARDNGSAPSWVTGGNLAYGTGDGEGANIYWGSMKRPNFGQFLLYLHHSTRVTAGGGATRYQPSADTSHNRTLTFNLGAGAPTNFHYKLEWFYYPPSQPTVQTSCTTSFLWSGSPVNRATPTYSYDLAVRLTRCPTAGINCAVATPCT